MQYVMFCSCAVHAEFGFVPRPSWGSFGLLAELPVRRVHAVPFRMQCLFGGRLDDDHHATLWVLQPRRNADGLSARGGFARATECSTGTGTG